MKDELKILVAPFWDVFYGLTNYPYRISENLYLPSGPLLNSLNVSVEEDLPEATIDTAGRIRFIACNVYYIAETGEMLLRHDSNTKGQCAVGVSARCTEDTVVMNDDGTINCTDTLSETAHVAQLNAGATASYGTVDYLYISNDDPSKDVVGFVLVPTYEEVPLTDVDYIGWSTPSELLSDMFELDEPSKAMVTYMQKLRTENAISK